MTSLFFLEAALLVGALSLDSFAAAFSYGVNKIKIPILSAIVITLVCSGVLAIALYLGHAFSHLIPEGVALGICVAVLFTLGLVKLLDSFIKSRIKKNQGLDKKINFKFLSLRCILNIYADPIAADRDESKTLSVAEAAGLAVVLSLDSLTAGFGAGLSQGGFLWIIGFSLLTGIIFVYLGCLLGRLLAKKTTLNLSWLSGIILILLGVSMLVF